MSKNRDKEQYREKRRDERHLVAYYRNLLGQAVKQYDLPEIGRLMKEIGGLSVELQGKIKKEECLSVRNGFGTIDITPHDAIQALVYPENKRITLACSSGFPGQHSDAYPGQ